MKLRTLAYALVFVALSFGYSARAQINQYAVATYDRQNKIIKLSNLGGDLSTCEAQNVSVGRITSIKYYEGLPRDFNLRIKGKGLRNIAIADVEFTNVDRSNLHTLLARGKYVRVTMRACGNGGFWTASIIEAK